MSLSPEQEEGLRRLLVDELRAAWSTAVARGADPAELAGLLDERRRAVASSVAAGDDPDGLRDDPVPDPVVGEQH